MNILLLGDNCIDEYYYGNVNRISPEAPVPVFDFDTKEEKPGMAANVFENFKALGVNPTFLTSEHSYKTRFIDKKTGQHLLRVDKDVPGQPVQINIDLDSFDCIVISDYDKGTITYDLIDKICKKYSGPIFIDTKKKYLDRFTGCIIKINELEYNNALALPLHDNIIITLGKQGAMFHNELFPAPEVDVFDVCGAGDTFLAALAYRYLDKDCLKEAIKFANAASAVTVRHRGVYSPTYTEILEHL